MKRQLIYTALALQACAQTTPEMPTKDSVELEPFDSCAAM